MAHWVDGFEKLTRASLNHVFNKVFINDQNNDCLASFLQFSMPKYPWWIKDLISARRLMGTMIRSFFKTIPSQNVISLRWV